VGNLSTPPGWYSIRKQKKHHKDALIKIAIVTKSGVMIKVTVRNERKSTVPLVILDEKIHGGKIQDPSDVTEEMFLEIAVRGEMIRRGIGRKRGGEQVVEVGVDREIGTDRASTVGKTTSMIDMKEMAKKNDVMTIMTGIGARIGLIETVGMQ
jgi:hypothetical protein